MTYLFLTDRVEKSQRVPVQILFTKSVQLLANIVAVTPKTKWDIAMMILTPSSMEILMLIGILTKERALRNIIMEYNDVEIKNVSEYIKWVDDTHRFCNSDKVIFCKENIYYRGQASKDWGLSPSVFRENYNEFELLYKARKRLHNQLTQFNYILDKIIYLQHYGLPTRLLDISYNPLVALYFSCLNHNNPRESKDGVVYYGYKREQSDSMQIAEDIAKIMFKENNILCILNEPSKFGNYGVEDFLHPLIVNPSYSNPRIERQKGAFIMAQLIYKDRYNEYAPFKGTLEDGLFSMNRAIIKECYKSHILKDLSSFGIDGGTLFLDPSDITKAIVMEDIWKIENVIRYE